MYIPIARKYRPQDFDSIIGQEQITKTLKNAISMDKIANAYVFSGTRGVGKTSTARIFAKALNCENGPTIKPCNKCSSCQDITQGSSFDVLEIDGASNRGIDEIRNLRENVKLKPVAGRYRVYIIDEVHMLTTEAFNALLKTLEEPPAHAKFIFATTRSSKIPATILSRCQRFEFRSLSIETISDTLKMIAKDEKVTISDEAVFLIAKYADGSMRDAEVLMDQAISYSKGQVTGKDISAMLGLMEEDVLFAISEAILEARPVDALKYLDELAGSGKDPVYIASSLIEHYRNMLILASSGGVSASVHSTDRARLDSLAKKLTQDELFYIIYLLQHSVDLISKTPLGKIPLEVAILKLCNKEKSIPMPKIIEWMTRLEGQVKQGQGSVQASAKALPRQAVMEDKVMDIQDDTGETIEDDIADDALPESVAQSGHNGDIWHRLKNVWPEVVRSVRAKKVSAGIYLEEGMLLELKGIKAIVGFSRSNALHKESLETKQNMEIIAQSIKELVDKELDISFVFTEKAAITAPAEDTVKTGHSYSAPEKPGPRKIEPVIRNALDKFDGKIVKQYFVEEEEGA